MTKSDEILLYLLDYEAVRRGEYSWRWRSLRRGPSLANPQTSKLFQANLVEDVNGEMKLTAMGKIIAKKVQERKL